MKNLVKTYFEWEAERRRTAGVDQWKQQSTVRKFMYVFKTGLLFVVMTNLLLVFFDHFLFGGIKLDTILVGAVIMFIFWFIGSSTLWRINERKYEKYLSDNSET